MLNIHNTVLQKHNRLPSINSVVCVSRVCQRKTDRQEAQLLQRDCAMLRVTKYFGKPLKVIRNDILEKDVSPC